MNHEDRVALTSCGSLGPRQVLVKRLHLNSSNFLNTAFLNEQLSTLMAAPRRWAGPSQTCRGSQVFVMDSMAHGCVWVYDHNEFKGIRGRGLRPQPPFALTLPYSFLLSRSGRDDLNVSHRRLCCCTQLPPTRGHLLACIWRMLLLQINIKRMGSGGGLCWEWPEWESNC